ncbi:MAG: GAF domain-containing protein [Leptospiraceae bacterium]|nr:GAF domain-containing protein [Leptospiraceae bacterium]MCK6379850.1 GAF domain-containing protein [Leptospiraceae bacterium]NUM42449.1 GAF domain-containing protein [Leptospiraceae bacterium]
MQKKQYIVTDNTNLESDLNLYGKKIQAEIVPLSSLNRICQENDDNFVLLVFYIEKECLEKEHTSIRETLKLHPLVMSRFVISAEMNYEVTKNYLELDLFHSIVPKEAPVFFLVKNLINAFTHLQMVTEKFDMQHRINTSSNEISKLTRIGISLSNEKDFTKLLRDILYSAREISLADSGSLYLVEKDENGDPQNLRFKISALELDSGEFILPINKQSIAGYVAATGKTLNIPDVYKLTGEAEYKFNRIFDSVKSYHSKSMLVVPMKNYWDEIVGVIQLINKKKNFNKKLTLEEMKGNSVLAFDRYSEELVMSVAGQAAVAIQNNNLIKDIETLFEGFVTASVSAIEARDPTTSGHSFRVANLTTALAETVDRIDDGVFSEIKFTKAQMKEIRYASLLHDFGKVGVREKVLVKAKKLEEYELELIKWRFYYLQKDLEVRFEQKKIDYLKRQGTEGYKEYEYVVNMEYKMETRKLNEMLEVIISSNEPTILEQSNSQRLEELSRMKFKFINDDEIPVITPAEYNFLTIRKGSLDFEERKEIESHVEHTFQFLSKIPWTGDLKMIPSIAHAHHEKLNGTGYPRGLYADEIPVQSKMMTIADIYDALTDKDRPYKKAVPIDRALDILRMEVKDNHVDSDLLKIFIEAKIYEKVNKSLA